MVAFTFDFDRVYPNESYFRTEIQAMEGGNERRMALMHLPRTEYTGNIYRATESQKQALEAFFVARTGPYETFTWTDPIASVVRTVRYKEGSYKATKISNNVWFLTIVLTEV